MGERELIAEWWEVLMPGTLAGTRWRTRDFATRDAADMRARGKRVRLVHVRRYRVRRG